MSNIQSLSIVVPAHGCINNCKFCVSMMHKSKYPDHITQQHDLHFDRHFGDYLKRLKYAQDQGVKTVILTGDTEPQQNWEFLKLFGIINAHVLPREFEHVEIQTTGTRINDDYLHFLRHAVGITTISLSTSYIFNDEKNRELNGTAKKHMVYLDYFCGKVKDFGFNLRLNLNLSDVYHNTDPSEMFERAHELNADQITFRRLYAEGNSKQAQWTREHDYKYIENIQQYIKDHGTMLETLDYGFVKYSVNGISTVLDDDCMSKGFTQDSINDVSITLDTRENKKNVKYLILRPDCKLYTQWDDKGSLIF